jgi:TonB family protein
VSSAESAPRQQAVAVEVPVTVNGARAMEGSNKREPFSETTKTVLVFGAGAVIRLSSSVAPGQLLFLTNERTKKEVVCQVVKSKNYRNISGYVELEFTEAAVGFWGMRFPGDHIGSAPQPAPVAARPPASSGSQAPAPVRPAAAKIGELPVRNAPGNGAAKPSVPAAVTASVAPKLVAPKAPVPPKSTSPGAPITAASSSIVPPPLDSASLLGASKPKSAEPAVPAASPTAAPKITPESTVPQSASPDFPTFDLLRTSDKAATIFASSPEAPSDLSEVDLSSLAPFFDVKPAGSSVVPPPPRVQVPIDPETETLKQHTARLQEELSTMNFAEAASDSPVEHSLEAPSFPQAEKEQIHEKRAQILEPSSALLPAPILAELDESAKAAPAVPIPSLDSLEQEELKIPSWLEPLARHAAAPSSTQELVFREKAKRVAEQPEIEELTAAPNVPVEEGKVSELRIPEFGSALPIDEKESPAASAFTKSGNTMLYAAMGAGIVLLAFAGWWYINQQSGGVRASVPDTQAPAVSAPATTPLPTKPQEETASKTNLPAQAGPPVSPASLVRSDPTAQTNSGSKLSGSASAGSPAMPIHNTQLSSNSLGGGAIASKSSTEQPAPAPVQLKKPSLGEVRLATPKVSRNQHAQNGAETDAGVSLEEVQPETDADSLTPSLKLASKEPSAPAAPLVVGGDVKQARLISSVPPVYPAMAKAQHVSGNVTVDALIDANGRVTTMKVVSGPSLLQQAAMDALKQWKYQPAMLDGKAVPMHLSVTIQFHLQ